MIKKGIILALCAFALGLSSCDTIGWTQVQNQLFDGVTIETATIDIVSSDLRRHPDHEAIYRDALDLLKKWTSRETLTIGDVRLGLYNLIDDKCKLGTDQLKEVVDKVLAKIDDDPEYNLIRHRDELLQVVSGIEFALKQFEDTKKLDVSK